MNRLVPRFVDSIRIGDRVHIPILPKTKTQTAKTNDFGGSKARDSVVTAINGWNKTANITIPIHGPSRFKGHNLEELLV
ncbi:MAG: hypothetical protein ACKVS6_11035 [Planctomycetota bacterium]